MSILNDRYYDILQWLLYKLMLQYCTPVSLKNQRGEFWHGQASPSLYCCEGWGIQPNLRVPKKVPRTPTRGNFASIRVFCVQLLYKEHPRIHPWEVEAKRWTLNGFWLCLLSKSLCMVDAWAAMFPSLSISPSTHNTRSHAGTRFNLHAVPTLLGSRAPPHAPRCQSA